MPDSNRGTGGGSGGGSGDLVDDLTPQLGGNLDGNDKTIHNITSLSIDEQGFSASSTGTGYIYVLNTTPNELHFVNDTATDFLLGGAIYTQVHTTSHTISAAECYGGIHMVSSAATITLPSIVSGMSVAFPTIGAVAVSVKAGPSDKIYLDGVALDNGDKITNLSTTGDVATLNYKAANQWYASTNSWTDGGA